jgi:hypothetical protein
MPGRSKIAIGAGAAVLVVVGAAVVTGFLCATSAADRMHWSVRFMEQTKLGKWLNRHITSWALNQHVSSLSDAERVQLIRDAEEAKQQSAVQRES